MDLYLPAEFFELRDALDDWRDLSSSERTTPAATSDAEGDIDPSWHVI
jgi:hypothetical protein